MRRLVPIALLTLVAPIAVAACAPARIALPAGPGTPVADFAARFDSASARCRAVQTFSAALALSGHAGSQALRARVLAGFAPGALRLEAVALGSPVFIFVVDGSRGRLLLVRDHRVLEGAAPADMLDALAGVPLGPDDLRALLSGCLKASAAPSAGRAYGTDWTALDLAGGGSLYLRRDASGAWRIVAGSYSGLDVEYGAPANGVPSTVRIWSRAAAGRAAVNMTVGLSQVEVNGDQPREALVALTIPPGTSLMTLDELRASGPLSPKP